jgi:hypothetical protein
MRRLSLAIIVVGAPGPVLAHDAFGDLGPFYASLLHPLADPLQATLVLGTAAFLAGRSPGTVRAALPLFAVVAALSHAVLGWRFGVVPPALPTAAAAVGVGVAAMVPDRWTGTAAGLILSAGAGVLVGLAPDPPPATGALQPLLGTALGLAIFATLAWAALDALARHVSGLAPAVAGSWVAAVGLLAGAFALQPVFGNTAHLADPQDATLAAGRDR